MIHMIHCLWIIGYHRLNHRLSSVLFIRFVEKMTFCCKLVSKAHFQVSNQVSTKYKAVEKFFEIFWNFFENFFEHRNWWYPGYWFWRGYSRSGLRGSAWTWTFDWVKDKVLISMIFWSWSVNWGFTKYRAVFRSILFPAEKSTAQSFQLK